VREIAVLLDGWQHASVPAYRGLADRLRLLVLDGRLPVHAVLPSERALAAATGTSRTTTTTAYRLLRETGFAVAGHGSGTWTALPGDDPECGPMPWPVTTTGSRGDDDGRGDLASAAPEAPSQVHAAYTAALADLPHYLPGHGYVTAGIPALRARIADRYTARGLPTQPEQVLVTAGAMHGLRLVLSLLVGAGDRVVCEHPTYPMALDAVRRAGGRPIGWDVAGGWDLQLLDAILASSRAAAAYLMPDFQNPTGRLLGEADRVRLAAVLARHGCLAIIDETTAELDLREPAEGAAAPMPPPFAAFSPDSICIGSASKTFWGGLRIGWVRADAALVRRLSVARAGDDLGSPMVEQLACVHLLDQLDDVLAERRTMLRSRRDALLAAIARDLPTWTAAVPDGGMVAWCGLPEPRSTRLAGAARALGVTLTPGPRFAVGAGFEDRVRLPFARPEAQLVAAVRLLAQAWRGEAPAGDPDPVPVL
jgi:DNA-binding transcriptional MocR family regulator